VVSLDIAQPFCSCAVQGCYQSDHVRTSSGPVSALVTASAGFVIIMPQPAFPPVGLVPAQDQRKTSSPALARGSSWERAVMGCGNNA
jgi:hypothetical protein